MARINGYKVGVPRYNPTRGWSYVKVWTVSAGRRCYAVRGPLPSLEACLADLRSVS